MRIVRIEHPVATREVNGKNYPAGPYADVSLMQHEHPGTLWWELDDEDECENCAHTWAAEISWDCGPERPAPSQEGLHVQSDEFFGFPNVEALREWFMGEFSAMHRFGFIASVYEVPDEAVRHAPRQSVFRFDEATKVGSTSVKNFPKMQKWLAETLDTASPVV